MTVKSNKCRLKQFGDQKYVGIDFIDIGVMNHKPIMTIKCINVIKLNCTYKNSSFSYIPPTLNLTFYEHICINAEINLVHHFISVYICFTSFTSKLTDLPRKLPPLISHPIKQISKKVKISFLIFIRYQNRNLQLLLKNKRPPYKSLPHY